MAVWTFHSLHIHIGANPAASIANLRRWLDDLARGCVGCGSPLARDLAGNRMEGCYHVMKPAEHQLFLSAISTHIQWTLECHQNNLNAGTLISIEPGGRGSLQMLQMKGGPSSKLNCSSFNSSFHHTSSTDKLSFIPSSKNVSLVGTFVYI